jgi:hypothetical protein
MGSPRWFDLLEKALGIFGTHIRFGWMGLTGLGAG